jgi:hypothetical protein
LGTGEDIAKERFGGDPRRANEQLPRNVTNPALALQDCHIFTANQEHLDRAVQLSSAEELKDEEESQCAGGEENTGPRHSTTCLVRRASMILSNAPNAMLSGFAASPRLLSEITPLLGDFQPSVFVVWAFH